MIASSVASGPSGRMGGRMITPYAMVTEARKIVLSGDGVKKYATWARKITAYAHHSRCARIRYVAQTLPSTRAAHFHSGLATNSSNPRNEVTWKSCGIGSHKKITRLKMSR